MGAIAKQIYTIIISLSYPNMVGNNIAVFIFEKQENHHLDQKEEYQITGITTSKGKVFSNCYWTSVSSTDFFLLPCHIHL